MRLLLNLLKRDVWMGVQQSPPIPLPVHGALTDLTWKDPANWAWFENR